MNWEEERINLLQDALADGSSIDGFDENSPSRIVTPTSLMIVDQDVVITYTNPDVEFSGENAVQNVNAIWHLIKGKSVFHLFVPEPSTHVTVEVGSFENTRFDSVKRAEAIVIKTLGHRLLAQFYLK
ncbi:MAG: hypothetical protein KDB98_07760, partial [Flavobacteriales bacterium]|nr:hypothetical protein [Flavobacteriales bacterium]